MRQAEKALRDAGWVRAVYGDLDAGEEFYVPSTGALLIKRDRVCVKTDAEVLRAPRPEPEYELGTVARIRGSDGDVRNAVYGTHDVWATGGMGERSPRVEVLRVIAYPDGTIPPDGFDADETTRVEVIDSTGRAYVNSTAKDVQAHFQDDGRTLKVFTGGHGSIPGSRVNEEHVKEAINAFNRVFREDFMGRMVDPEGVKNMAMRAALKAVLACREATRDDA